MKSAEAPNQPAATLEGFQSYALVIAGMPIRTADFIRRDKIFD